MKNNGNVSTAAVTFFFFTLQISCLQDMLGKE